MSKDQLFPKDNSLIAIIPDIHNKVSKAETLAKKIEMDTRIQKIIFLGDYFDDFHDQPKDTKATAIWLKESLAKPNRLHLVGNHDLAYFYPWNPHTSCPGWERNKQHEVNKILNKADIKSFKAHCIINRGQTCPTLISHAGLTISSLYGVIDPKETDKQGRLEFLNELSTEDHLKTLEMETTRWQECLVKGEFHHFMNQGSRVGQSCHGGPQWLDWRDLQSNTISNLNQIVGHSIVKHPELLSKGADPKGPSSNYCLDTNLNHFYILNPKTQEIHGYTAGDSIDKENYKILWQDITPKNLKKEASWEHKKLDKQKIEMAVT